jgi:hypothetical protein
VRLSLPPITILFSLPVVAGLRAVAAVEFDLGWGVELDGDQLHLEAVDQRAEEVGDRLRVGRVAARLTGRGDGDRDGRAAAVADRVAIRRGAG